jgi:hypothetical protein
MLIKASISAPTLTLFGTKKQYFIFFIAFCYFLLFNYYFLSERNLLQECRSNVLYKFHDNIDTTHMYILRSRGGWCWNQRYMGGIRGQDKGK